MELRPLRYFVAVAEELSFSAAAKRLNLSQPPLTEAIKGLERELEVKLFNRTSRKVELTDAGNHLLESARSLLNHAERVALSTKVYGKGKKEVVRLAFHATIADVILPQAVIRFRKKFPDVYLELQTINYTKSIHMDEVREYLINDLADIVIGAYLPPDHEIDSVLWKEDGLLAIFSENHPLSHCKKISIHDLRNESFLLSKISPLQLTDVFFKFCRNVGHFEPKISQICPDMMSAITLATAGEGVMIMDSSARWLPAIGRVLIPIKDSPIKQWGVAWQRNKVTPALKGLLQELRTSIKEDRKKSNTSTSSRI